MYRYPGGSKQDRTRLFSVVSSERAAGDRHTLKHGKMGSSTRDSLFCMRLVKHRDGLPSKAVQPLCSGDAQHS